MDEDNLLRLRDLPGSLWKAVKMTGYKDQDFDPCVCLGLFMKEHRYRTKVSEKDNFTHTGQSQHKQSNPGAQT